MNSGFAYALCPRSALRCGPVMESMTGLLAMVRLRQGSDLHVVDEDRRHRTVDLMSITGKQILLRGVSLAATLEVVWSAEGAVNPSFRQPMRGKSHRTNAEVKRQRRRVTARRRASAAEVDINAADERTLAILASGFAVLAALLAAVGLYCVLAYSTQTRTREIGVRLVLGAPRYTLLGMVISEMVWIVIIATLVALPGTVALAHLFQSQLYGVRALDLETLAIAVTLTAITVALAAALPACRATSVNPVEALRSE